jgi:hypothetical protein
VITAFCQALVIANGCVKRIKDYNSNEFDVLNKGFGEMTNDLFCGEDGGNESNVSIVKEAKVPFLVMIQEKYARYQSINDIAQFVTACGESDAGKRRARRMVAIYNNILEQMVVMGASPGLLEHTYALKTVTQTKRKAACPNAGNAKKVRATETAPELLSASASPSSSASPSASASDEDILVAQRIMQECQESAEQVYKPFLKSKITNLPNTHLSNPNIQTRHRSVRLSMNQTRFSASNSHPSQLSIYQATGGSCCC